MTTLWFMQSGDFSSLHKVHRHQWTSNDFSVILLLFAATYDENAWKSYRSLERLTMSWYVFQTLHVHPLTGVETHGNLNQIGVMGWSCVKQRFSYCSFSSLHSKKRCLKQRECTTWKATVRKIVSHSHIVIDFPFYRVTLVQILVLSVWLSWYVFCARARNSLGTMEKKKIDVLLHRAKTLFSTWTTTDSLFARSTEQFPKSMISCKTKPRVFT